MNEVSVSAEAPVVVKSRRVLLCPNGSRTSSSPKGVPASHNCGKRVLLEELKSSLDADPNGHVVFVGHTSADEKCDRPILASDVPSECCSRHQRRSAGLPGASRAG